jgi:tetratricopeptide (TPR) repeat protein
MNRGPAQDDSDDDDAPSTSKPAGPYRTDPKGDEFKKDAEKRLKAFSFFSGNTKYEEAIELFEKSAAQYKMNKNWQEAGEVYKTCAEIYKTNLKEADDEGRSYENAAKAFKNVNTKGQQRIASTAECQRRGVVDPFLTHACMACSLPHLAVYRGSEVLHCGGGDSDGEQ